ncbi:sensor histidine kinase [uncultured Helicobacter sp.]|uniref:sensor histidine kinase n=1 Tax=uncultured Helicobacter sp. TaxID=175537 RepID=UPI00374F2AAF
MPKDLQETSLKESLLSHNLIESLDTNDKQKVLDSLLELIKGTYQLEEEFKSLKNLYNNVLELLPQAIWVLEKDGNLFYQNNQAYAMPEILTLIQTSLGLSSIKIGEIYESELEYNNNAYMFKISLLSDKTIITAFNITNQKRQERLASMGQVSAHLAHEIRNPVGSISILTSTLLKRGDSTIQPIATEIKKSIWRIERLINATLLFSKGISVNKKLHTLHAIEQELKECIAYYTYAKDIEFIFRLNAQSEVLIDFDLFSIVLQNFVFNAIDAIEESDEEQGIVEIWFSQDSQKSVFYIRDNGKAIEDKNVLFEPFKSTKLKGNGLGLALSQQIVIAHNGKINLQDNGEKVFEIEIAR